MTENQIHVLPVWQKKMHEIVESGWFGHFIIGVILLAGLIVGLETFPEIEQKYSALLHGTDRIILGIFILEILMKMAAHGKKPWLYFRDGWNVFDFLIVAVCLLPFGGESVAVLRLARLLRVLRLIGAVPHLQMLIGAMLKAIPSMGYISILLLILFYIYGVGAVFMFGKNDPMHFGNLQSSMLTMFQLVTLEGWNDILYTQIYGCAKYGYELKELCTRPEANPIAAPIFFISFIILGTMIVLNLVIGIVLAGMEDAKREIDQEKIKEMKRKRGILSADEEAEEVREMIRSLNEKLHYVKVEKVKLKKR